MAPARQEEEMLHSHQLRLFLSTEMGPSWGSRDDIRERMDINCLDILSSFLPVLPLSLGRIKGMAQSLKLLGIFFASTFHLEEGTLNPWHCSDLLKWGTCRGKGTRIDHTKPHPPLPHCSGLEPECKSKSNQITSSANTNHVLFPARSRLKLINQGFKKIYI